MRYRPEGRYAPLAERFWRKVEVGAADECWPFQERSRTPSGYGRCWDGQRTRPAHQIAYELGTGPIPEGTEPHHTCDNRACCNPAHLEAITHAENLRRSASVAESWARNRKRRWTS